MVRRMMKAGIPTSKALKYEERALLVPMSEAIMAGSHEGNLAFILQATRSEARAIQACISE